MAEARTICFGQAMKTKKAAVDRNTLFAIIESIKQEIDDGATRNLKAQQKPGARARELAAEKGSELVAEAGAERIARGLDRGSDMTGTSG